MFNFLKMNKNNFYKFFDEISPQLGVRQYSFTKIFNYLDKLPSNNYSRNWMSKSKR